MSIADCPHFPQCGHKGESQCDANGCGDRPVPEQRGDDEIVSLANEVMVGTVDPHDLTSGGIRMLCEAVLAARGAQQPEGREPYESSDDDVICPNCCSMFRAIPVSVQKLMLDAGFEPPFTAAPAIAREPLELSDKEISEIWEGHTVDVFGRVGINPVVFARRLLAAANARRAT